MPRTKKNIITRVQTPYSISLDEKIKHLLLITPTLDFKITLRTLCSLPELSIRDKESWIERLKKRRKEFIVESKSENMSDGIEDLVKEYVNNWNEFVAPITLEDVRSIVEGTNIALSDVAEDLITPRGISNMLNNYLIGQPEYSQKLALCFYLHYMRNKHTSTVFPKCNLLAYGPSGVGKTYGPQILAKLLNFKFGVVNCNSLVQEGIRGPRITDVFDQLYSEVNDAEEIEDAVILFDEFDKLFDGGEFNERILNELLNIIDDNNSVSFEHGYNNIIRVPTRNMLFIFSGVFKGIEQIVAKRLNWNGMGFGNQSKRDNPADDYHKYLIDSDFAQYFSRDELTGRIAQYAYVNSMTQEIMVQILTNSKESPLKDFQNYFSKRDIELTMTSDGADAIARYAYERKLGVRGLKSTLFKVLNDAMFDLKKMPIVVDKQYVAKMIA